MFSRAYCSSYFVLNNFLSTRTMWRLRVLPVAMRRFCMRFTHVLICRYAQSVMSTHIDRGSYIHLFTTRNGNNRLIWRITMQRDRTKTIDKFISGLHATFFLDLFPFLLYSYFSDPECCPLNQSIDFFLFLFLQSP